MHHIAVHGSKLLLRLLRYLLIHVGKPWGAGLKTLLNIQFHWEKSLSTTTSQRLTATYSYEIIRKISPTQNIFVISIPNSHHKKYIHPKNSSIHPFPQPYSIPPMKPWYVLGGLQILQVFWDQGNLPKLPNKANRSRFTCFAKQRVTRLRQRHLE